jgi:hypothetical protein
LNILVIGEGASDIRFAGWSFSGGLVVRVNAQNGSAYDHSGSAPVVNGADSTGTGSAVAQVRNAPASGEPVKDGLTLPIVDPRALWVRLQGFEKGVWKIEQKQRAGASLSDAERWAREVYNELRRDPLFGSPDASRDRRAVGNPGNVETTTPVSAPKTKDGPRRKYVGGAQIKRDYTLDEGTAIVVDALSKPFSSFAKSATDSYRKLNQGHPISKEEKQNIDRYTRFVDAAYSVTPQGQAMLATAHAVEAANQARKGQLPSPDSMQGALQSTTGTGGSPPSRRPPRTRQPPAFRQPTRLPDGRLGYPLSPTQPPRLPAEQQPAGPSGPQTEQTPPRPANTPPQKKPTNVVKRILSRLRESSVRNGQVGKLIGKGPFNVEPPANEAEENQRIHQFPLDFDYYRKDGEGGMSFGINMEHPISAKEVLPDLRKDVLTVGNGAQVTSESSHSKVFLGDQWGPSRRRLSKEVPVIELANGRNGVGAIKIPYENLKPGQTLVVTGGSLSGCTMMYASDTNYFYAYHAGTYGEGKDGWLTSRDGANAIRYASDRMKNDTSADTHDYEGNNNDLVHVGNEYPFSVIVYNGKHDAPATSGEFLKPSDPQPLDARITVSQNAKKHGTHAFDYRIPNQQVGQLGTAEAVISKSKQGKVSVRVLAERGEIELPEPGLRRGGKYTPVETKTYEYKPQSQDG